MSTFAAFAHHLCFVAIMLLLSFEMLLLNQPLTLASVRKIMRYDTIYGAFAGAVLIIGALRVMYFEKGPLYYMHSTPFMVKMALFIAVGLISLYPTFTFLKWRKQLQQGVTPELDGTQNRKLRIVIHVELTLLLFMMLCATMMAKGIGYAG